MDECLSQNKLLKLKFNHIVYSSYLHLIHIIKETNTKQT